MKFLSWLKPSPPVPMAQASMTAPPMAITTSGAPAASPDKIEHARYRLDAIKRTIAQSGDQITETHLAEFRSEVRDQVHTLTQAGLMTDDEAAALIKKGGA